MELELGFIALLLDLPGAPEEPREYAFFFFADAACLEFIDGMSTGLLPMIGSLDAFCTILAVFIPYASTFRPGVSVERHSAPASSLCSGPSG